MAYADDALLDGLDNDGQAISSEQRMLQTLMNPSLEGGVASRKMNNVNTARIRYALAQLTALNVTNVQRWLEATAEKNPAAAVGLYLQLLEYSTPKLKAVAVDVRSGDGSVKNLSMAELQNIVASTDD